MSAIGRHAGPQTEYSTPSQVRSCGDRIVGIVGRGDTAPMHSRHGGRCCAVRRHRCDELGAVLFAGLLLVSGGNDNHRIAAVLLRANLTGVLESAPGACVLIPHWDALILALFRAIQWITAWHFCTGLAWGWRGCAASVTPIYWTPIIVSLQREPCGSVNHRRF